MLTQEKLKSILHYDPETGIFTRKQSSKGLKAGAIAGSVVGRGYLSISIEGKNYSVHRLVWMYVYGSFPNQQIDHRDGDKLNNKIDNLRECSNSENHQNRRSVQGSTSRYVGVSWCNRSHKWKSKIVVNGEYYYLGLFLTEDSAYKAYCQAKSRLHKFQPVPR